MMDDPRTEPLREWNRLARENAENAIVASMFEAASLAREPIEIFSTWLLAGTAAVASFLITNADKVLPLIKQTGFYVCGAFLCLSCIFGLLSKMYALGCKIGSDVSSAVKNTFLEQLEKHKEEEKKIKEGAEFWGITLETGVRLERIMTEFYNPLPKVMVWLALRQLQKYASNPQVNGILQIKKLNKQGLFASLQSLSFLGFLISGFVFAAICH
ncbi:hypothetical protein [Geobacter anodireducens]|uniref:Uncharacterized protein n=1 Tax=Geobacter anodireducens TaxID=1340425 RepID=A0ABR9NZM6_9BACT|nr:hypothetical protein [Geobacter anodireducens]MBE2889716.1 hypothetical protein [Geobacter anodireducens]